MSHPSLRAVFLGGRLCSAAFHSRGIYVPERIQLSEPDKRREALVKVSGIREMSLLQHPREAGPLALGDRGCCGGPVLQTGPCPAVPARWRAVQPCSS